VATSRTLIGLTEDRRRVVLATVERSTVGAVATVLARDFGVWDAVNLDGGGSTTLVVDGAMVQGPKSGTARAVASSLAVFARRP
jgi:exopolysaccharide biosynthesis protein